MSYTLAENWKTILNDVREERLVSQNQSIIWKSDTKHGVEEGSVSRDILSFISRQENQTATKIQIVNGLPTAFAETASKTKLGNLKDYMREIKKMGLITENDH